MAGKCKDLTGFVTESGVTVLRRVENKGTKPQWECQCFCGNIFITRSDALKSGHTKSCGCLQKQKASATITNYNQSLALDLTGQRFGKLIARVNTHEPCKGGTSLMWECLCDCGNICYVSAQKLTSGVTQSCGCLVSKGEAKIRKILQENNICFETQKQFDSCLLKRNIRARFDFFLPEQNTIIEYDGDVHFETNNSGWNTEENLKQVQERDKIKTLWCLNNDIILIRIPYTHYNELDIQDLLPETSNFIITNGDYTNE